MIDLSRARKFHLESAEMSSGDDSTLRFPCAATGIGDDGPLLRVTPATGDARIGMFADAAYGTPPAVTNRVLAMPDGESFVVVAGGRGIIVNAATPAEWAEVSCFPISTGLVTDDLVIFGDFTDCCAHSGVTEAWHSGRVAWDELELRDENDGLISATGWHAPTFETRTFVIDATNGPANNAPWSP